MTVNNTVHQITIAVITTVIGALVLDYMRNKRPMTAPPPEDNNSNKWFGGSLG